MMLDLHTGADGRQVRQHVDVLDRLQAHPDTRVAHVRLAQQHKSELALLLESGGGPGRGMIDACHRATPAARTTTAVA
jgi:hypothetical protein